MSSFISYVLKHKNLLIIALIVFLCLFIVYQNSRINNLNNRNKILNQDYEALVNNLDNKNKELYVVKEQLEDTYKKFPEMEHMIDSLKKVNKSSKVKIKTVEVDKIRYVSDSVFIETKGDIDTVITDQCMTTFFAMQKGIASIVVELNGKIYVFHTTEKVLVNPSQYSFINFIKKLVGRKKTVEKVRIADDCGLLEDMDVINITE